MSGDLRARATSSDPLVVPGSGRSTIAFITLKIVVTEPVPSDTIRIVTIVKTGLLRSMRAAKRMSPITVCSILSPRRFLDV